MEEIKPIEIEKPVENTNFKVLFLTSHYRYNKNAVQFRGLKDVEIIKVKEKYFYYFGTTSLKKQSERNLKEAKDAGFVDAKLVEFKTNKNLDEGNYVIELFFTNEKIKPKPENFNGLDDVQRELKKVIEKGFLDAIIIKK